LKEFQRVVLESELLHVEVIPALGAKVASMRMVPDGAELLQRPLLPYADRTRRRRCVWRAGNSRFTTRFGTRAMLPVNSYGPHIRCSLGTQATGWKQREYASGSVSIRITTTKN
jgi:hypothetical protein